MELRHALGGEVRASGALTLSGLALPWGEVAHPPAVPEPERFRRGAFGDLASVDAILNRQHERGSPLARTGGGGLVLEDGDDGLRLRAHLPDTAEARDTVALVRAGVLRGLSVEFTVRREERENGVRTIAGATLYGVAVVDSGAYQGASVEARHALRRVAVWL